MGSNLKSTILSAGILLILAGETVLCDICELPPDSGECEGNPKGRQLISRYYYSSDNLACSPFPYSGCGGNNNNFASKTECEDACGNYREKVRNNLLSSISSSKCFFEGRFYNINEEIQTNKDDYPCSSGCLCVEGPEFPRIVCALVDCPQEQALEANCSNPVPIYKKGSCCPEFKCPTEVEQTCSYNNENYYHGQIIYPDEYSCFKCNCGLNYTGRITTKDNVCTEIKCGLMLYRQQEIMNSCVPNYYTTNTGKQLCCPIDWKCKSK